MKLKGFVTCVLTATVAMGAVGLTACNGNDYSETYAGTISQQTYSSQQLAAQAFLAEELSTPSENAALVSYEKQGELTQKEIKSLSISTAERESISSAERGTVLYTLTSNSTDNHNVIDDTTYSKGVYILDMGDTYRYYDPAPVSGEALTNSYLQSVLSDKSYANCTMQMNLYTESTAKGETLTVTSDYVWQITDDAVHVDLSMTTKYKGKTTTKTMELYAIDDNGTVKVVFENKGTYVPLPANEYDDYYLDIDSTDQLADMSMPGYLDASFFEKTDTGFKMREDKVFDYIWNYAKASGYDRYVISKAEGGFDFIIKDGRICESTSTCSMNIYANKIMVYSNTTSTYKYYNFGKTTVNLPDDARIALGLTE